MSAGEDARKLKDRCAIVGIGNTDFSKDSGRSELKLACEVVKKAIDDAGLSPDDVDGMVKYDQDNSRELYICRSLGLKNVRFLGTVGYGGGQNCGSVALAVMAVVSGMAHCVVSYRAMNGRSGGRYGRVIIGGFRGTEGIVCEGRSQWTGTFGMLSPTQQAAPQARRYMHLYGATTRQFGAVAVACRKHACMNPNAMMYGRPITLEDHENSRIVADPLRVLDCCLESDGGSAVIVTSAERARDLRQPPVYIMGVAQGMDILNEPMTNYPRDMASFPECKIVAERVFAMAGVTPQDIDVAEIYDAYTFLVPVVLEEFGFCQRGEGGAFVEGGQIELGGELPVNTHGGNLSEAYIHGMPHIVEGVKQLRGTSTAQVKDAELALVTSAPVAPASALILRR